MALLPVPQASDRTKWWSLRHRASMMDIVTVQPLEKTNPIRRLAQEESLGLVNISKFVQGFYC